MRSELKRVWKFQECIQLKYANFYGVLSCIQLHMALGKPLVICSFAPSSSTSRLDIGPFISIHHSDHGVSSLSINISSQIEPEYEARSPCRVTLVFLFRLNSSPAPEGIRRHQAYSFLEMQSGGSS